MYDYFEFYVIYFLFVMVVCTYNGASFFIDKFSVVYANNLKRIANELEKQQAQNEQLEKYQQQVEQDEKNQKQQQEQQNLVEQRKEKGYENQIKQENKKDLNNFNNEIEKQ
jgi:biopolymer transport protein ExbB/TolQ